MDLQRLGSKLRRVLRSPVLLMTVAVPVTSRCRRWAFRLRALLHGGGVRLAPTVRFVHKVVFQGLGTVIVDENVVLGAWLSGSKSAPILLQPRTAGAVIRIGPRTAVVNGCEVIACASIVIGADCLIGAGTSIIDSDFHGLAPDKRRTSGESSAVTIGDNVWFGNEVMVLKGVTIGRDAVLGARCVVTKDVPPGAIAVGNPMRIVGSVYA